MFNDKIRSGIRFALPGCALVSVLVGDFAFAAKSIHETQATDAQGSVVVNNMAGSVEVVGWDKLEVEVTGTIGDDVERVDITGDGHQTSVQVIVHSGSHWGSGGEAHLVIKVPAKSSVRSTLVSADFKVAGLKGDLNVRTVSGEISGETGADVHANSVSGDVHVRAAAAKALEIKTVSGDIIATGGDGETEITTVSGDAKVTVGTQSRAHFKTVSGTLVANLGMSVDARIDAESVSGDVSLEFAALPVADFDVQTFSGDIENCFGPKPTEAHHGSGSRLTFRNGEGEGRVHIGTQSGDVRLCARGQHR